MHARSQHPPPISASDGRRAPVVRAGASAGAAWGKRERVMERGGGQLYILSYELGALCLPSLEAAYRAHRHRGFSALPTAADAGRSGGGGGDGARVLEPGGGRQQQQQQEQQEQQQEEQQEEQHEEQQQQQQRQQQQEQNEQQQEVAFYAARQASPAVPPAGAAPPARVLLPVPYPLPPPPYRPGDLPWACDVDPSYFGGRRDMFGRSILDYRGAPHPLYWPA
ncbi:hypothetical protein MNEG_15025 [Monoraphidium neglectum]|uniref:Uncharacterized protein n=1 Tax=Monoraphidium neglectum TaxID=145388 RepID=A0A0D2KA65_9CHLO|nr:hypothetical protein MNEG_15025 [Monoraphidium neglectum]KIY92938.1 hypothetical protein MNEG_15025 [Monoraphidium neglectum]|eukprot:XP_013891958.1 hypothetical protein MNEG_15025 [Monoraphidium neglectum]